MEEPKCPSGEHVWVRYKDTDQNTRFIMTSKPACNVYFLYELKNDKFVKLGKSPSPRELEETFHIDDVLLQNTEIHQKQED